MSTCISQHGEYSEHEPSDDWSCNLCGAFDEPGVLDALKKAEAKVARGEALAAMWEGWAALRSTPRVDAFRDAAEALRAALAEPERDEERGLAVTAWDEITEGVTLHDVRANPSERDEEGGR